MSNALVLAAHARGMGFDYSGATYGDIFGSDGGGGGDFNWNSFANVVGGTLSNIFGRSNNSAQQLALLQQQQALALQQQQALAAGNAGGGGIGFGVDSQGIRLSDGSHIGWTPIALGVGVLFLLQSPGFSRRRNPARRNPKRHSKGRRRSRR